MKKILVCMLALCLFVSLVGCGNQNSAGNVVQNTYSGELVEIFEKEGKTILKLKTADDVEIDFTYTDSTISEGSKRNLISGQQLEVKCEEYYPDNGYHPLLSIKIL